MRIWTILFLFSFLLFVHSNAQNCITISDSLPVKCLEIESLLVDACTNNEGLDEMARIRIGPNPIPLNSLTNIIWTSSNPFQGWASFNAANLSKIAIINNEIAAAGNCGKVIKVDPGETLPAYAKVLLITSTVYNVYAQDFSGLTDTLYVILHNNTTVTTGHFNNYGTSASRTFQFGTSTCVDVVTYDRSQLRKQNGQVGAQDGGTVYFNYAGSPVYGNSGCTIPMTPLTADAGTANPAYCQNDMILLIGSTTGAKCVKWRVKDPLSGQFSDTTSQTTVFLPSKTYVGPVKLYFLAIGNCSKIAWDSLEFIITAPTDSLLVNSSGPVIRCNKNPISLTALASSGNMINWMSNGAGTFNSYTGTSVMYTPNSSDTGNIYFWAKQILTCGSLSDTVFLILKPAPDATLAPVTYQICANQPLLALNPKDKDGTFISPYVLNGVFQNPGIAGSYSIKYLISKYGCTDSSEITIVVKPTTVARFTLSDSVVCMGSNPILVTPEQNGGVFSGMTMLGNTIPITNVGQYILKYTVDNGSCIDSFNRTIEIIESGDPEFKLADTVVCEGDAPVLLTPVNTGGIFSGTYVIQNYFVPLQPGYFRLMHVYGRGKCADTSYHNILVLPKPQAKFSYYPNEFKVFDTITFTYTGSPVNSYFWYFGDGGVSSSANNTHVYKLDETYPVILIVQNAEGCLDTAMIPLVVKADVHLYVPNAITPNGDGLNDRFLVTHLGIRSYEIKIFDNWGRQVYQSNNMEEGWDGKSDGIECISGVYVYTIKFIDRNSESGVRYGNVTVLR